MRPRSTLWQNLGWGLMYGGGLASLAVAYVLVLFVFRGSEPFEDNSTTLPGMLGAYAFGAVAGGVVLGALRPLARSRLAYMVIGVAVALPVTFGLVLAMRDPRVEWGMAEVFAVGVCSLLYGLGGGYYAWTLGDV